MEIVWFVEYVGSWVVKITFETRPGFCQEPMWERCCFKAADFLVISANILGQYQTVALSRRQMCYFDPLFIYQVLCCYKNLLNTTKSMSQYLTIQTQPKNDHHLQSTTLSKVYNSQHAASNTQSTKSPRAPFEQAFPSRRTTARAKS